MNTDKMPTNEDRGLQQMGYEKDLEQRSVQSH